MGRARRGLPEEHPAIVESRELFVRRWGEMGGYWGINRTMAEIHALLYLSCEPLCTDDVMEALLISRGSASMNLRSLLDWGLIRREHQRGDRREYFVAETNVWRIFETIMRERRRREVEPIVRTIERARGMVEGVMDTLEADARRRAEVYHERLTRMLEFLGAASRLLDAALALGPGSLELLNRLLSAPPAWEGGDRPGG